MSAVRTRRVSDSPARPGDSDKMWVQWKQQLTAYVQWVNSQLKKKAGAHLVEDLRHDVRDGVALIDLLEVIAGEKLPEVHPSPSTYGEMRHNVDQVLHFMTSNKIKMHHITTRDIVDGNLKAIMRLILALAAHYKPNSVRHSSLPNDRSLTGLAQGAAAALTEARRSANRAGHRYRRRRQKEEKIDCSDSDHSQSCPIPTPGQRRSGPISLHPPHHQQHHHHYHHHHRRGRVEGEDSGGGRAELEGASSSPTSSQNASPRTSLYLSDPPSSMEGLLTVGGHVMLTSCESDNLTDSGFQEVCESLHETHQALFQLQDLLLNGSTEDGKRGVMEELDGMNVQEANSILKARLLHTEEVAQSLRAELARVKNDCLQLQGTTSGLQHRLTEQDSHLSAAKSELMKVELEKETVLSELEAVKKQLAEREQVLSDVKTSYVKQVEEKDRVIGDLRRDVLKCSESLTQMRALHGEEGESQPADVNSGSSSWHSTPPGRELGQRGSQCVGQGHNVGQRGSPHGRRGRTSPGRGSPLNRRQVGSRGPQTPTGSGSSGSHPPPQPPPRTAAPRATAPPPARASPLRQGQRGKAASPGTVTDGQTQVIYFLEESDKPLSCVIRKKLGEIRLKDLKTAVQGSGQLHFFFKALDPEYGTVKEELCQDEDVLPGWEGKIVAWLESEKATVC